MVCEVIVESITDFVLVTKQGLTIHENPPSHEREAILNKRKALCIWQRARSFFNYVTLKLHLTILIHLYCNGATKRYAVRIR